jgi:hypothetical protein
MKMKEECALCADSSCSPGNPMKQYKGWMITADACKGPSCTKVSSTAVSIEACMSQCEDVGYEKCKSVSYVDAEVCNRENPRLQTVCLLRESRELFCR